VCLSAQTVSEVEKVAKKRSTTSVKMAKPAAALDTKSTDSEACTADRVEVRRSTNEVQIAFFRSASRHGPRPAHGKPAAANGGAVCVASVVVSSDMLADMIERLQASLEDRTKLKADTRATRQRLSRLRVKRMTPSNAQLRKLAAKRRPPAAYFEGDMERPW